MTKIVYVITGNRNILKKCLKQVSHQKSFFWIYLGKEVQKCNNIEIIIGGSAKRVNISDDLQECARTFRQEYIDYIGRLSLEYDNPLWPLTSLSEKNPFVSDFFLNFCYLKIGLKCIVELSGNLIIVCENRCVFQALRENLQTPHDSCVFFYDSAIRRVNEILLLSGVRIRNKLVFLSRYLLRVVLANLFHCLQMQSPSLNAGYPPVIMHSWADSRSFYQKNGYNEVYLGDLNKELEKFSKNFIYLVDILPTLWYPNALFALRHIDKKIYLMEDFLTFREVILSLILVNKGYPHVPDNLILGDVNVGALVSHDFVNDKISSRMEQCYLNFFISQKIGRKFPTGSFLYSFENHTWEKAFCAGFSKFPGIKTIGYAIVFINQMYTCFSVSRYEKENPWFPDTIIVSGIQGKKMLVESGFDQEKVEVGGAVRYPNIHNSGIPRIPHEKKNVLVVLGPSVSQSLEMLDTALLTFSDTKTINIIVKCHPIVPMQSLSKYLSHLPEHFQIAKKTVDELLKITDLVIYAESTVCVEALAKGIPVLHIGSNFTIDINIFEGLDIVPSANSPEQIRSIALEILKVKEYSPESAHAVIRQLFAAVDYQKIYIFVSGDKM